MKLTKASMAALVAVSLLGGVARAIADQSVVIPPGSMAYGQSFAEWLRDDCAWSFGVGDQIQRNQVMFMPVPTPSEWQDWDGKNIGIGEMDLTVKPGTKLVLGVLAWIGETYQNHGDVIGSGIPDDQPWPKEMLLPPQGEAVITLDGVPLITSENVAKFYYGPISFKETIWYGAASDYGSTGIIWVQGIGIILSPLSVGEHTLTLYSWDVNFPVPGSGPAGQGWSNTWHITVSPPGK